IYTAPKTIQLSQGALQSPAPESPLEQAHTHTHTDTRTHTHTQTHAHAVHRAQRLTPPQQQQAPPHFPVLINEVKRPGRGIQSEALSPNIHVNSYSIALSMAFETQSGKR